MQDNLTRFKVVVGKFVVSDELCLIGGPKLPQCRWIRVVVGKFVVSDELCLIGGPKLPQCI